MKEVQMPRSGTVQIYKVEVLLSNLVQFLLMVSIKGDVIDTKSIP